MLPLQARAGWEWTSLGVVLVVLSRAILIVDTGGKLRLRYRRRCTSNRCTDLDGPEPEKQGPRTVKGPPTLPPSTNGRACDGALVTYRRVEWSLSLANLTMTASGL